MSRKAIETLGSNRRRNTTKQRYIEKILEKLWKRRKTWLENMEKDLRVMGTEFGEGKYRTEMNRQQLMKQAMALQGL